MAYTCTLHSSSCCTFHLGHSLPCGPHVRVPCSSSHPVPQRSSPSRISVPLKKESQESIYRLRIHSPPLLDKTRICQVNTPWPRRKLSNPAARSIPVARQCHRCVVSSVDAAVSCVCVDRNAKLSPARGAVYHLRCIVHRPYANVASLRPFSKAQRLTESPQGQRQLHASRPLKQFRSVEF